jgi:uncharacterized membrane protein YcjF (UPF0283 family)
MVVRNRRVWLEVSSLLFHVWDESCFKQIRPLLMIFWTLMKTPLGSIGWSLQESLFVQQKWGLIFKQLRVVVMGVVFDVWVVEEATQMTGLRNTVQVLETSSSACSHDGPDGGGKAEFLEEEAKYLGEDSDASPRASCSVRREVIGGTNLATQNLN